MLSLFMRCTRTTLDELAAEAGLEADELRRHGLVELIRRDVSDDSSPPSVGNGHKEFPGAQSRAERPETAGI